MSENEINPLLQLMDPNNNDNIVLYNENDEPVEFEQVAIIPMDERIYAILKPVITFEGTKDDEAFVLEIIEDEENGDHLAVVSNDIIIDRVFEKYYELFDLRKNS